MAFMGEPEEFIEATSDRIVSRRATQMPLANEGSRIASIAQTASDGSLSLGKTDGRVHVRRADRIELESKASLVTARHQCRSRRCTERCRDVSVREPDAFRRDGIHVRRGNVATLPRQFLVNAVALRESWGKRET